MERFFEDKYVCSTLLTALDLKSLVNLTRTCRTIDNSLSYIVWEDKYTKIFDCVARYLLRECDDTQLCSVMQQVTEAMELSYPVYTNEFWKSMCMRVCREGYNILEQLTHPFEVALCIKLGAFKSTTCLNVVRLAACQGRIKDKKTIKLILSPESDYNGEDNSKFVDAARNIPYIYQSELDDHAHSYLNEAMEHSSKELLRILHKYKPIQTNCDLGTLYSRFSTKDLMYIFNNKPELVNRNLATFPQHIIYLAAINDNIKLVRQTSPDRYCGRMSFESVKVSVRMLRALLDRGHRFTVGSLSTYVTQSWCTVGHVDVIVSPTNDNSDKLRAAAYVAYSVNCSTHLLKLAAVADAKAAKASDRGKGIKSTKKSKF